MASSAPRHVSPWRLGLLLVLGATLLGSAFSYDEWVLIGGWWTSGAWSDATWRARDLRRRAVVALEAPRRRREQALEAERELESRRAGEVHGSARGLFEVDVQDIAEQPDGKLLVGGTHRRTALGIARLNLDGSLDEPFVRRASRDLVGVVAGSVRRIVVQPDGGIVLLGRFGWKERGDLMLLRLRTDGTLDEGFVTRTSPALAGATSEWGRASPKAPELFPLPNGGAVLFGAALTGLRCHWWRLAPDGTPSPQPHLEQCTSDARLATGSDGSILVWRPGVALHTGIAARVTRLGSPAVEDDSFVAWLPQHTGGDVTWLTPARGGSWLAFLAHRRPLGACGDTDVLSRLALFDAQGHRLWNAAIPRVWITDVGFQPDGRIVIAGGLGHPRGLSPHVWRLDAGGAFDPSFEILRPRDLTGGAVQALHVQADGRIVIGGTFTGVRGRRRVHLARLRGDGAVEE